MSLLSDIQGALHAPKDKKNSFGGYNYRSAEGILEAVKPILQKHGAAIVLSDEPVLVGSDYNQTATMHEETGKITSKTIHGRIYIKATACLVDADGKEVGHSSAYAREEETKKGMDAAQITGSASSYARKYALNGLLAIDDGVDPDSTNKHGK